MPILNIPCNNLDAALCITFSSITLSHDRERVAATCRRLAETQRNLPVPMTDDERDDLRLAAKLLREKP